MKHTQPPEKISGFLSLYHLVSKIIVHFSIFCVDTWLYSPTHHLLRYFFSVGGTLGGIAATIVSNPADVVVTELKKSKTDMSPWEAIENLKTKGLSTFARGMSTRLIFYPILVSLQFFLYDTIRIALGVGGDDMKLFLNVLNVALNEKARV